MSKFFEFCVIILILNTMFQTALLCVIHFSSGTRESGRGDFDLKPFESKRSKTLDCTCGTLPTSSTSPSKFRFPWDVLITHIHSENANLQPTKLCRGSVVNSKIILSSASCIFGLSLGEIMDNTWLPFLFPEKCFAKPHQLRVWLTYGGMQGKQGLEVISIYTSPMFLFGRAAFNKVDYDIALLTLKTPLTLSSTGATVPVCLPTLNQEVTDTHLEGIDTLLTRWYLAQPEDWMSIQEEKSCFESSIYPRMRCRLNSKARWISDRFLCTIAPYVRDSHRFIKDGGALVVKNGDQYTQIGVHSWTNRFPLIHKKKALNLASNVLGFIKKIEEYSQQAQAQWCKNEWKGLPEKSKTYKSSLVNAPENGLPVQPWIGTTSTIRNVRKSCRCGLVNSKAAKTRIQGGKDAPPYEYGWQAIIFIKFKAKKEKNSLCGAAVINSLMLITACHCVYKNVKIPGNPSGLATPEDIRVYVHRYKGAKQRDDESRLVQVEAVIPHPNFTSIDLVVKNDIAIIILKKPLCFNCLKGKVSPLCFPRTNENLQIDGRTDAKVIGFGRTKVLKKGSPAKKLQELSVRIISRQDCIDLLSKGPSHPFFQDQVERDEKKICAGTFSPSWNYSDAAQGDSGGPLFCPIFPGSSTMIHVGVASMISMSKKAVEMKVPQTVTFYTKSQGYIDFVDYYSSLVDAVWCSR